MNTGSAVKAESNIGYPIMTEQKYWHRNVGIEITPEMSLNEQLEAAGLNWTVERSPYCYGDYLQFEDDNYRIAYRSDNGDVLDRHGPRRKVFQNAEIVQAFHDFCDNSSDGLAIERLGCLDGGKSLFATAKLKHTIDVAQVGDLIETRVLLTESHISGVALQVRIFYNRLICTNGMTELVKLGGRSLNHMKEFDRTTVQAYLEAAYARTTEYEETLNQLAATTISKAEARMHLIKAFGNANLPWEDQPNPVKVCFELFGGTGMGSEMLSAYDTLFGLSEAVKEYSNWHMKGSNTERAFSSVCFGSRSRTQEQFLKQLVGVHLG